MITGLCIIENAGLIVSANTLVQDPWKLPTVYKIIFDALTTDEPLVEGDKTF